MMRIRPIPTSVTLLMAAVVLLAPLFANLFIAQAQTPAQRYCSASICAEATNIAKSRLSPGPDFAVHYFTMKDGSDAGVYVGGHPQRPAADVPKAADTVDGAACDRYEFPAENSRRQISLFCDWRKKPDDFPSVIHAWAVDKSPEASQAMALVRSLKRCTIMECPWP